MTNAQSRLIALSIAALLSACGSSATSSTADDHSTSVDKAEAPPVEFGKAGIAPGLSFTVLSVEQRNHIGAKGLGPNAEPGETFVVVRYSIKNTASKPLSSNDRPDVNLIDDNGQTYAEDNSAAVLEAGINNDLQDSLSDLNPGVLGKATSVWKIAKASFDNAKWRLQVTPGGMSAKLDDAARWPSIPPLHHR